jgi:hypothetical protein
MNRVVLPRCCYLKANEHLKLVPIATSLPFLGQSVCNVQFVRSSTVSQPKDSIMINSTRLYCPVVAIVIAAVCAVTAFAMRPFAHTPPAGVRVMSASELEQFVGGLDIKKDCFISGPSCTTTPCPPTGAYPCTDCAAGPTSVMCLSAQTDGCLETEPVDCQYGLKGSCFGGSCALFNPNQVAQCGVYYTCVVGP